MAVVVVVVMEDLRVPSCIKQKVTLAVAVLWLWTNEEESTTDVCCRIQLTSLAV